MFAPELTQEQIVERERIESEYGGTYGADHYYGHLAALLRLIEKRITEGYTPLLPEDEGYFENLRDNIMARMKLLGASPDLDDYDEEIKNLYQDLRE